MVDYNEYLDLKAVNYFELIEILTVFSKAKASIKKYSLYLLNKLCEVQKLYEGIDKLCFFVDINYVYDSWGIDDMFLDVYVDDENYTFLNSINFFDEYIFVDNISDANRRVLFSKFDEGLANLHQLVFCGYAD